MTSSSENGALVVEDLAVSFSTPYGLVKAVRGISFRVERGGCLGLVGESGSGKSVTARSIVGLAGPTAQVEATRMEIGGSDTTCLSEAGWRGIRGRRAGFILQDALSSLDPLRRIEKEIAEPLRTHRLVGRRSARPAVIRLLNEVGMPEPARRARQYPHQLSGGLRQRALIASAIAGGPDLLITDEPTTALDVTVQVRILELLARLKEQGATILLISHDLAVVGAVADRIAVMYDGEIVESGESARVLTGARHPYTRALLAAVPSARSRGERLSLPAFGATEPVFADGCHFAPRCPLADELCRAEAPPTIEVGTGHLVNCFHLDRPYPITPVATRRQFPVSGDRLSSEHPVLQVREISKHFKGTRGTRHLAVDRVSFDLRVGETLGLVGESGSGKTTVARIVLGLTPADSGNVLLEGEAWSEIREPDRRERRRVIQAIYQDPLSSFDPRFTVGRVMGEALGAADHPRGRARQDRVGELFDQVGLSSRLLNRYPVELSGGQRQRVAIARALASRPRIIICDEPVSALDVSVQAQVLDLLVDLQHELGVALLFISHDLGVVHHVSDRVAVMREGQILEIGSAEELFARPNHPYTAELVSATPRLPTQ